LQATARPYHHGHLREALLRAAELALEARGAGELSLRDLARQIGVSHTSPRRHFADKRALLDALACVGFQRLEAALVAAGSGRSRSFQARLCAVALAFVDFGLKHPALWMLMAEAKHRPGAPANLVEAGTAAYSQIGLILREGQKAGEITHGDPLRLSLTLNAALQGLITMSTDGKFKGMPVTALVPETVKQIMHGLKPR
jgi:AcrR family transcriptional regulator